VCSAGSENFIDLVDRAIRETMARADGNNPVEPALFFRAGFENRGVAEIAFRGVHRFAFGQPVEHGRVAIADATIGHEDTEIVISDKGQPHIQLPGAVIPN